MAFQAPGLARSGAVSLTALAPQAIPTHSVVGYALRLRGVRVQSHMGVGDAERATLQGLVVAVDIELGGRVYPFADELERAVDYSVIVQVADDTARERPYRLLETFALRVAHRLLGHWPAAEQIRVGVTKACVPVAPPTDEATVEVTLGKAVA